MPKKIQNSLTEQQKKERIATLVVLNMNLAHCHLKRDDPGKAIKHSKDAIELEPENSKAHYRLYLACKASNDLDQAKVSLQEAVKLEPKNAAIRREYQELLALKNKKEKEWYSKMSGFLGSEKLQQIEKKDQDEQKLMHKIKRQCFRERPPRGTPNDDK